MDPNSTSPFDFTVPEDIWQRAMDRALTTESWPEMDESDLVPHFFGPLDEDDPENDDPYGDDDSVGGGDDSVGGGDEFGDDYLDTDPDTDSGADLDTDSDFGLGDDDFGGFDD